MEKELEHRLTAVEDRTKSNTHRLEDLEKRQDNLDELVGTVKVLAVREENVETTVQEIKEDVKSLTAKPAKKWDGMIDKIFLMVVAALVALILSRLGL